MYSNVIDGSFTVDYTYKLYMEGSFVKVPVIFGDDTNEGSIFTYTNISNYQVIYMARLYQGSKLIAMKEVNGFLRDQFPRLNSTELAKIDSLYPPAETFNNTGLLYRTASNAYGEMRYNCPGIYVSTRFDQVGVAGNWNYQYVFLPSPISFSNPSASMSMIPPQMPRALAWLTLQNSSTSGARMKQLNIRLRLLTSRLARLWVPLSRDTGRVLSERMIQILIDIREARCGKGLMLRLWAEFFCRPMRQPWRLFLRIKERGVLI